MWVDNNILNKNIIILLSIIFMSNSTLVIYNSDIGVSNSSIVIFKEIPLYICFISFIFFIFIISLIKYIRACIKYCLYSNYYIQEDHIYHVSTNTKKNNNDNTMNDNTIDVNSGSDGKCIGAEDIDDGLPSYSEVYSLTVKQ